MAAQGYETEIRSKATVSRSNALGFKSNGKILESIPKRLRMDFR